MAHSILREEWRGLSVQHGWAVGRYVVMPDHAHFFFRPLLDGARPLSEVVGRWKEWTAKRLLRALGEPAPLWQPEFFDHVLRSAESLAEKWIYVQENPVRAGLVTKAEDWPWAGSIDFEVI
jgi:putative transposase